MAMFRASSECSKEVLSTASWMLRSGIQNRSPKSRLKGGVSAWYEIHDRRYPFLYSEITGYAIASYMFMNRIHPDPVWLSASKSAANWLVKNAFHASGGVRTRYYLVKDYQTPNYSFHAGRIYAFDTAMVGYGLLQLHKIYPRSSYWKWIQKSHHFLTKKLKTRHHYPSAYWDQKNDVHMRNGEKWSDQTGSFHAKVSLFLIDYYRFTRKAGDRREAVRLLDAILLQQKPDGRFVTNRNDKSTHLHPHCYALEGLIYGAHFLEDSRYLKAAVKGFRWLRQAISDSGSVSSIYERTGFAYHERSDIVAQVLRLGSVLHRWGAGKNIMDRTLLKKMRDHLLTFQFNEAGSQNGGFLYGADTDGRLRIHLNAWASMFSLQALWMFDAFVMRGRRVNLESFI
jgi:hypothetical protein